jgi:predicted nucleic acid-binding protein
VRYWDSSALLPLLVREDSSASMAAALRQDPAIVTWWGTRVECVSAIARLERDRMLSQAELRTALAKLEASAREWTEVPAIDEVRMQATRLLRVHRLRAADALQLAAAIVASDYAPRTLAVVTLDARMGEAAEVEGFRVAGLP